MDTYEHKANEYLSKIKCNLTNNKNPFLEKFDTLLNLFYDDLVTTVSKNTSLYRARIYSKNDRFNKYHYPSTMNDTFEGYNKIDSYVNLTKNISEGRCNYVDASYLYTSTDIETCALEVCNKKEVAISIAEIKVKNDLKIVDFSKNINIIDDGNGEYDSEMLLALKVAISEEMNSPFSSSDEYCLTQYISNYFKLKSADGIMLNSTSHMGNIIKNILNNKGKNLVIFNHEKCEAVNSKLYLVNDIDIKLVPFRK